MHPMIVRRAAVVTSRHPSARSANSQTWWQRSTSSSWRCRWRTRPGVSSGATSIARMRPDAALCERRRGRTRRSGRADPEALRSVPVGGAGHSTRSTRNRCRATMPCGISPTSSSHCKTSGTTDWAPRADGPDLPRQPRPLCAGDDLRNEVHVLIRTCEPLGDDGLQHGRISLRCAYSSNRTPTNCSPAMTSTPPLFDDHDLAVAPRPPAGDVAGTGFAAW